MLGSEMVACLPAERWVVSVAPSIPRVLLWPVEHTTVLFCRAWGRGPLSVSISRTSTSISSFFFNFFYNGFKRKHQWCHVYLSVLVSVAQRFLGFT